jgi:hypothetical protein
MSSKIRDLQTKLSHTEDYYNTLLEAKQILVDIPDCESAYNLRNELSSIQTFIDEIRYSINILMHNNSGVSWIKCSDYLPPYKNCDKTGEYLNTVLPVLVKFKSGAITTATLVKHEDPKMYWWELPREIIDHEGFEFDTFTEWAFV